jgi:hypothetical protein
VVDAHRGFAGRSPEYTGELAGMHRWYWEAQKEVSELMGPVEHAADGRRM